MDIPKTPLKIDHKTLNQRLKRTIPNILKEKIKISFICGDSSHCARDCEKRFKPKESNDHIHNRINVNTLKVESEKQNSDEFCKSSIHSPLVSMERKKGIRTAADSVQSDSRYGMQPKEGSLRAQAQLNTN
ncbi:hypothetical protein TNCV_1820171 [Trichonephila clavipes]|nr:hypothetical protein TNCV_1820171 [Trichonephila clavipes]